MEREQGKATESLEELLDQTREHVIVYPIPEQISMQLSQQAEGALKRESVNECAVDIEEKNESRSVYQKRKRDEEKRHRRKKRRARLLLACVFVMIAGMLCGAVLAVSINTPRDAVEIASANAQYVKYTVSAAVSSLAERLPWNEDGKTENNENTEHQTEPPMIEDETQPGQPDSSAEGDGTNGDNTQLDIDVTIPVTTGSAIAEGIDPSKPMIALTFDDGPSQYTWTIVSALQQHNARATFFLVGDRIATHQSAIDFTLANGNEIASHGFSHKNLVKLSEEELLSEIQQPDELLLQQHNYTPALFRVPYGERDNRVLEILRAEGKPVIGWSVDPRDWELQDKDKVVAHVLSRVRDGDIVLMHDLYKPTADAVVELIPALQAKGYQLVTVSELFQYKGAALQPGSYYYRVD